MLLVGDYKIVIATEADQTLTRNFMLQHFLSSEPLNEALKTVAIYLEIRSSIPDEIDQGLSPVATDSFGNIIGAIENGTLTEDCDLPDYLRTHPVLRQIGYVTEAVESKMSSYTKQENNKVMEIYAIAVHKDWRQKGIGKALLRSTIDLARQKEFTQLQSVCTSYYSTKLFANIGFDCVCNIEYTDFINQGKLDVLPSAPHTSVSGMVLKIEDCLS